MHDFHRVAQKVNPKNEAKLKKENFIPVQLAHSPLNMFAEIYFLFVSRFLSTKLFNSEEFHRVGPAPKK